MSIGPKGLRRSLHFVPGGNDRMLNKALSLAADSLILDLEDSVTPDNKDSARKEVCDWIKNTDFGRQECLVRINPLDSPWGRADLDAVMEQLPDGIVLPKVADRESIDFIDDLMTSMEQSQDAEGCKEKYFASPEEEEIVVVNLETHHGIDEHYPGDHHHHEQ